MHQNAPNESFCFKIFLGIPPCKIFSVFFIAIHSHACKNEWLQVDYLCQNGFNSENLPNGFVMLMQHQILINVIIFVAYVLNLPLNTQRSHSRSQRAGKWSLMLAHDRRPIYRAPTYIAVPLLGPHQPRYIGLTLYIGLCLYSTPIVQCTVMMCKFVTWLDHWNQD